MKDKYFVKLTVFLSLIYSCAAFSNNVTYTNVFSPSLNEGKIHVGTDEITFNIVNETIEHGHVQYNIMNCGEEVWECRSFGLFIFAHRKEQDLIPQTWNYEGTKYDYLGVKNLELMGVKEPVHVFTMLNLNTKNEYEVIYYSSLKGLVAFSTYSESEKEESFYILKSGKGLKFIPKQWMTN